MNTYLGIQWNTLMPVAKEILPVDEKHRIKIYQHVGRNILLYVPQFLSKNRRGKDMWYNYTEKTGSDGSWDSWATYDLEEAKRKCV